MAHLLLSPLSAERSPTSQPNVQEISVPPTVGQYLFAARLLGHGRRKCCFRSFEVENSRLLLCTHQNKHFACDQDRLWNKTHIIDEYLNTHTHSNRKVKKWSVQSNFMSTTSIQVAIDRSTPMNRLAQDTLATTLYRNKAAQRRM